MTVERVSLIGGEMYGWSDLTGYRTAGGASGYLCTERFPASGARVLVAGPHDIGMIRRLMERGANVSWLMRSQVDAVAVANEVPELDVLCGSLTKLPTVEPYDMVIALDGLTRLCSTEGPTLDWHESFHRLLTALADGGTLQLSVENPVGLHHLVAPDAWFTDRSDGAWTLAGGVDATKPANLRELAECLDAHGLTQVMTHAAYAQTTRPVALVDIDLMTPDVDDVSATRLGELADLVGNVARWAWRDRPVVADPQWLTTNAIRNGMGAGLACAWLLVAAKGTHTIGSDEPEDSPTPPVLIADEPGTGDWSVTYGLEPTTGAGWTRRVLSPLTTVSAGTLRREPAALGGAMPIGDVLEQQLIAACLRHDHPQLRQSLMSYAAWLGELVSAGDPRAYFATPRNVVVTPDEFLIRDQSWQETADIRYDVVLAKALREFAVEVLTAGYSHPWPSSIDANQLTVILAAMAGLEIEVRAIDEAVAREADLVATIRGLDEDAGREFGHHLAEAGATSGSIDNLSFQRLRQAHARQAEEIDRLRDKLAWLDGLLASHEKLLSRAQRDVSTLKNSISFRVGRVVISPAVTSKKLSRQAMRRIRKTDQQ